MLFGTRLETIDNGDHLRCSLGRVHAQFLYAVKLTNGLGNISQMQIDTLPSHVQQIN